MFLIDGVHFDKLISNWHTPLEKIGYNVLILVIEGKVEYLINDEKIIVESGEILFIPISVFRSGSNHQNKPHQKYAVIFNVVKDLTNPPYYLSNKEVLKIKTSNFDYIKHRIEKLYRELRKNTEISSFISNGILQELLGLIGDELHSSDVAPMKLNYVQTIQTYLLEHYRESIEIEDLAKLIHRSQNYTISICKEIFGYAPIQYIHYLRITEACNLLLSTDMTIINISEYLGYYDASYFSKTFKKIMSMSPSEYRNQGIF